MKKRIPVILIALVFILAPLAKAGDDVWTMAESDQYGKKVGGQLGRGFLNLGTCFVDIITQTVDGTQHGTPFVGTITGLGSGIACAALRAMSGALDLTTFWVPGFNGFAVSKSYNNCLDFGTEEAAVPEPAPEPEEIAAPVLAPKMEEPVQAPEPVRDVMEYVKK